MRAHTQNVQARRDRPKTPVERSRDSWQMNATETSKLETAGRAAMAWIPEGVDGRPHYKTLLAAAVPAVGILAVAATLLLAVL